MAQIGIIICALTPVAIYRGGYHYLFFHLVFASLFFAYFSCVLCEKYIGDKFQPLIVVIFTLLVHSVSMTGALGAKINDLRQYKKWEPYHDALKSIGYNERIGILRNKKKYATDEEFLGSIFGRFYKIIPAIKDQPNSQLSKSFRDYFVFSDLPFTPVNIQEHKIKVILGVSDNLPEQ